MKTEQEQNEEGGSAFPGGHGTVHGPQAGMSLRDYFAAKALQALASATNMEGDWVCGGPDNAAAEAYKFADAMLKAREI